MLLEAIAAAYAAVAGLIVGSYLNVVIHRLPRGMSTVLPRSRCPACGAAIRARDNLPLASWLLLGGRCRACAAPIAWRYPAVEAATALLFAGCVARFGVSVEAAAAALLCALLVALAVIDLEHLLLPDRITLPGIAAGVALQPWLAWGVGVRGALLGAALGGGLLLALYGLWYLLRREEGLGLGDVKMLAMIGAFLGWRGVVVTLFCGSLAGALFGLALIRAGRGHRKTRLPLGTFLAFGAVVALFAGAPLMGAYLRLL
ncbi:MAG TPA: prepilin peptidase [Thermoanaerobaculia bacterium]|nr:prepilin peptidase [Thermoanaerobaculia bacterium]